MWQKYCTKWSLVQSVSVIVLHWHRFPRLHFVKMTVIADIAHTEGGLCILLEITESLQSTQTFKEKRKRDKDSIVLVLFLYDHFTWVHFSVEYVCPPRNSSASLLFSCFILFSFSLALSLQSRSNCQSRKNEQWDWIWLRTYSVTVSSWGCSMHYLTRSLKWNSFHAVSMLRVHEAGLKIPVPLRYCQKRQWAWPWSCVWRSKADTYNARFLCWISLLQWNFN